MIQDDVSTNIEPNDLRFPEITVNTDAGQSVPHLIDRQGELSGQNGLQICSGQELGQRGLEAAHDLTDGIAVNGDLDTGDVDVDLGA